MVKMFGLVYVGYFIAIFLCVRKCTGYTNTTGKTLSKRQTDSFIVSANYGVQSGNTNSPNTNPHLDSLKSYLPDSHDQTSTNSTSQTNNVYTVSSQEFEDHLQPTARPYEEHLKSSAHDSLEVLPTASPWRGSNFAAGPYDNYERHLQSDPPIYVPNAYQSYGLSPENTATTYPYTDSSKVYSWNDNNLFQDSQPQGLSNYRSDKLNTQTNSANIQKSDNSGDIVYGTVSTSTSSTEWYNTKPSESPAARADEFHTGYEVNEILSDTHKPSVKDLQKIISKIVKGATKVHQVVKVPAVYEIHLQEQEVKPGAHEVTLDDSKSFKVPLPQWTTGDARWNQHVPQGWHSTGTSFGSKGHGWKEPTSWPKNKPRPWKKPFYPRGVPHATKTWNLPKKINYFNNKPIETTAPIYGKYSYPKPFTSTKWESSGIANAIPLDPWKFSSGSASFETIPAYYGSVSVPMTPGSTAVTFLDYGSHQNNIYDTLNHHNYIGVPDLSLYYAKKGELENKGFLSRNSNKQYRRNDKVGVNEEKNKYRSQKKTNRPRMYLPFSGVNYIIHVREKTSK